MQMIILWIERNKWYFGCTCVTITENDVYRGCVDTANARDFLRIEHRIVIDPDYVDTCEVYS